MKLDREKPDLNEQKKTTLDMVIFCVRFSDQPSESQSRLHFLTVESIILLLGSNFFLVADILGHSHTHVCPHFANAFWHFPSSLLPSLKCQCEPLNQLPVSKRGR